MDQELTFVRRELATNTFWLRSYGTIRKSFTSCQTSCLSRQSMQGKWQITRPIRLWGAACWDMQSHRVNKMQQQSNALQEAFCFSSQSFQRPQHTYTHAAYENNWGDCSCSPCLADADCERVRWTWRHLWTCACCWKEPQWPSPALLFPHSVL